MVTITSRKGSFILKPDTKIQVPTNAIVATATDVNGFHHIDAKQFAAIAKLAKPSDK